MCTDGKEISQSYDLNLPPGARCAHNNSVCQGVECSKWWQGLRRKLSACWNSPRQCQVCNDIFGHVMERIRQPGGLSTTGTSVGRAGLSIWYLPRHTWGSHRVLVRCENNFESSPFSPYIARRHMFNITCKINSWKCTLLFEWPCILYLLIYPDKAICEYFIHYVNKVTGHLRSECSTE
jgi:hypothetical protein